MKQDFVVRFPDAQAVAVNAGAVTQKLQQMACGWVYDTRKTPNPAKPGKFIVTQTPVWFSNHKFDLLEEVLDGNQRVNTVVVYNYVEEQAELLRRYPHAATIDQPGVVDRWNRGEVPLLLIHPRSAGHGLNLQHGGSHMVFLSLPWSLEEYEQTIGRLHRSGQRQDVWVYVLLANQTIDERIWSALHDKRAVSDIAMKELTE
jgi:SNF2 family DNA or RNA helicase